MDIDTVTPLSPTLPFSLMSGKSSTVYTESFLLNMSGLNQNPRPMAGSDPILGLSTTGPSSWIGGLLMKKLLSSLCDYLICMDGDINKSCWINP
eukprot:TRINITY_DN45756_c0_g1_i1.p1 TRINITY_DN45756_c0_g1~~TRINITY_DN45756_c0_g1_i1.p1  ORF type:complete len:106 (+),score=16.14 TRINITY_DN45756_c0_g1_i1:37-318(+)